LEPPTASLLAATLYDKQSTEETMQQNHVAPWNFVTPQPLNKNWRIVNATFDLIVNK
jgi:hypothetical protein